MKKPIIIFGLCLAIFCGTSAAGAQSSNADGDLATPYPARVLEAQPISTNDADGVRYQVQFQRGPEKGKTVAVDDTPENISIGFTSFKKGQRVLVAKLNKVDGETQYLITDYERRDRVWAIVGFFVLAVIWFSRWRGVRSVLGLVLSYVVIIYWIVPRIVQGQDPVMTTILGGTAMLLVSLLLTEGWGRTSQAAGVGMIVTMLAIGLLSAWAVRFTYLTGGGSEEAFLLQTQGYGQLDVRGLLLAGFIIGTLGILDDIAVAQVSTVAELRRANRSMTGRAVYDAAMRVGRSHMSAIVNTLVLAYAGSALPLLVLFGSGQTSLGDVINGEVVATEIVRSVIGSLGLVLAMPITTIIAVWFGVRSSHPVEEK